MPIAYRVDPEARTVVAAGHGVLTDADVLGNQREVWARPEVSGYDGLIDMSRVARIDLPSADRVRDLARLSARMDATASSSRLAVVAPEDLAFGPGRMFQAHRRLDRRSRKEVGVFRTLEEALAFLQVDHPPAMPDLD